MGKAPVVDFDPFLADPNADNPEQSFDVPLSDDSAYKHIANLGKIAEEHPELQAGLEKMPEGIPPGPADQQPEPEDQAEQFDVEHGTVTIRKTKNGWEGVLEQEDGSQTETFRGATKSELMVNVLAGKLKATAQIKKLNRKLKVGEPVELPVPVQPVQTVQPRELSANDVFEIKTALEADPDKAFDLRFQKKYGMSEAQFVALVQKIQVQAQRGEEAADELTIEGVSKEFLESHKDDYHPWEENGTAIMGWLVKNKLRRQLTKQDTFGSLSSELLRKGLWTVSNLEEAFEDLQDSGLLTPPPPVAKPVRRQVEVEDDEPLEQEPTPRRAPQRETEPQNPRIVSQRRQSRGGLGLRPSAGTQPTPPADRAPSGEDLENLSTEELGALLRATNRYRQQNRR